MEHKASLSCLQEPHQLASVLRDMSSVETAIFHFLRTYPISLMLCSHIRLGLIEVS